jgi:protein tyrosine/serine phosphatase
MTISFRLRCSALVLLLATAVWSASPLRAQAPDQSLRSAPHIENFGQVDDSYFRGAQPEPADYPALAAFGVRTVIDLTKDGRSDESSLVQRAGMKFVRIPLTTSDAPSRAAVADFLKLVSDPANLPVFVHCQGGRHRTGTMTAIYRITKDGWSADRAYQEMKQYGFETLIGHPVLKKFVYDFAAHAALSPVK